MPRLCATARLTSSDGPNTRAFRKIEYVGGGVTPWMMPEIHPNQGAESKNVTRQICKMMIEEKHVYIYTRRQILINVNMLKVGKRRSWKMDTHNADLFIRCM